MTPGKAKNEKKNTNTFCSWRKKRKFANKTSFNENTKKTLAESDHGCSFNQEEQWQSNDSTSMASSLSSPSSSAKKLKASKQAYLNDSFTASSDSETDYYGSSEEISDSSGVIGDALFAKPRGNYIINPSNIQELLQTRVIEEKVKDQSETDFSNARSQLKQFKLTIGEVDRTKQELADKVYTSP